jgi:hypothetical protein
MAKFSQDSKVGDIVKDEAAKAVIESFFPGFSTHPQLKMAFGMTLKAIAAFPQAKISKEMLAEMDAKLQALG